MSERKDGGPDLVSPAKIRDACELLTSGDTWRTLCLVSMSNAPDGFISNDAVEALDKFVDKLGMTLGIIQTLASGDTYISGVQDGEVTFSLTTQGRERGSAMLRALEVKQ
jgi:hypothetical protein